MEPAETEERDRDVRKDAQRYLQRFRIHTSRRRATKFTKARNSFYLINIDADSKTIFKFRQAKRYV